jgi:hypothetical protein
MRGEPPSGRASQLHQLDITDAELEALHGTARQLLADTDARAYATLTMAASGRCTCSIKAAPPISAASNDGQPAFLKMATAHEQLAAGPR